MSQQQKYDFSGKVALVTGSSSGIGAAIALKFAQYGARVTITGRNKENLQKIADQLQSVSSQGHAPLQIIGDILTDHDLPQQLVTQTVAHFGDGRLDFLVNNAGGGVASDSLLNNRDNLLADWDKVLRLNVRGAVELIQLAMPHLGRSKGNVINISSGASLHPVRVFLCLNF